MFSIVFFIPCSIKYTHKKQNPTRGTPYGVQYELAWHPPRLINEGGRVDLSLDTLHLKYPWVLFGSEGSALTLPLFLLSPRIIMLCHCSSTMKKDHLLLIYHGTKWPLCVGVPLSTYLFISKIQRGVLAR